MKITLEVLPTIVFAIVMLCWLAFTAVFIFRKQPANTPDQKRDRSSIPGLVLQALAYAIVWSIHRPFFSPIVAGVEWLELVAAATAIAAAIGSVLLITSAVKTLGKEWSITARM